MKQKDRLIARDAMFVDQVDGLGDITCEIQGKSR